MERRGSAAWLKFVVDINGALFIKHWTSGAIGVFPCSRNPRRLSTGDFVHAPRLCAILVSVLTIRALPNARCRRALHWRTAQYVASLAPGLGPAAPILGGQPGQLDDHCGRRQG